MTVEAYVRVNAAAPRGIIYQLGANQGLGLDYDNGTHWRLSQLVNPTGHFTAASAKPVEFGRRLHVAGVCSTDRFLVFVDGKQIANSGQVNNRTFKPGTGPHRIGQQFKGLIEELRVSKVSRYKQEFTPEPRLLADPQTLALYHFDEGSGGLLKDSSGKGHHGKIIGAKWVPSNSASAITGRGGPEREAAVWVLSSGGAVTIREDGQDRQISTAADLPRGEVEIHSVRLHSDTVDFTGLTLLQRCRNLRSFDANACHEFDDAGLAHLRECREFGNVGLFATKASDAGLVHLANCHNLSTLHLESTQVSDAGLKWLVRFRRLSGLQLQKTKVTESE